MNIGAIASDRGATRDHTNLVGAQHGTTPFSEKWKLKPEERLSAEVEDVAVYNILTETAAIGRGEEQFVSAAKLSDTDKLGAEQSLPYRNIWGVLLPTEEPVRKAPLSLTCLLFEDGPYRVIDWNPVWKLDVKRCH